jgi:hypothetical protein
MGKTRVAVKAKLSNLGLSVVVAAPVSQHLAAATAATATSPQIASEPTRGSAEASELGASKVDLELPEQLSSIEEKLKVLDAASKALQQPGLSRGEVLRLHKLVESVRVYNDLFAKFVNYRGIESELLEVRKQLVKDDATETGKDTSEVSR